MFAHFVHYKGKGILVILLPMALAGILFSVGEAFSWNDKYIPGVAFLISGMILFYIGSWRKKVNEGTLVIRTVKLPREKGKDTFMWIELKYWGILVGLIGVIWLINVVILKNP